MFLLGNIDQTQKYRKKKIFDLILKTFMTKAFNFRQYLIHKLVKKTIIKKLFGGKKILFMATHYTHKFPP